jgi:DNA-binding beta-propeller fold protein YncE
MSGRRAIGLMMLILAGLFAAANVYAFSQEWRQRDRLIADGLRQPRGMVWMPDQAIVVAEAGLPGTPNSGRLTWASASSARQTMLDSLPSDDGGGPVALELGPAGLLVLTGPCGQPRCSSLLGPDANGELAVLAAMPGRSPWGLALSADGVAYVTDRAAGELLRIGQGAEPAVAARFGPGSDPRGIALGPDGAVYVALLGAGSVARVDAGGGVSTAVGGLAQPIAVGLDPEGRLLVLEQGAGRVTRAGEVVARDLEVPSGLLVAPDGRTYVTTAGQLLQIRRLGPVGPRRLV